MKKVILCFALVGLFVSTNASTSSDSFDANVIYFDNCSDQGNDLYDYLVNEQGYTHREARAERRQFVRFCRAQITDVTN